MNSFLYAGLLISLLSMASVVQSNAQTQPATAVPVVSADSANLNDYSGTYTFPSGSPIQKFTVSADKGELYGEADTFGKNKLVKQAKTDTYQSTSSYGSIITFVRDTAKKTVTGLTLAAQGSELVANKENP
ncbi:DUF3471 domain-containing protein [Spirosoma utsteinense]|uniref:Peptidase S12 Pab87-related C-terminal domain-containing protein n=1 Tax=Spirosoma utsteinense TaxID=2585773 RepID=A0ABR6W0G9_9BACT|nr:DUF3471 domain-containing protein [Spirosoma utsteinense]MBC3784619.1 hypothetical protein [Spirosoma utsteinense]MBC3789628.1 hypothetical protein [Spirosoma utsteinense]